MARNVVRHYNNNNNFIRVNCAGQEEGRREWNGRDRVRSHLGVPPSRDRENAPARVVRKTPRKSGRLAGGNTRLRGRLVIPASRIAELRVSSTEFSGHFFSSVHTGRPRRRRR